MLNHTELNSQPGSDLGTMGLVDNRENGLVPGIGTNSAFGSIGNSTYDPRQIASMPSCSFDCTWCDLCDVIPNVSG